MNNISTRSVVHSVLMQVADWMPMKIAYVVPYVPNRIRTRPYNLINQLSALGHEVVVFTLGSSKEDLVDVNSLRPRVQAVNYHVQPVWNSLLNSVWALPSPQPLQTVYSWNRGMADQLVNLLKASKSLAGFDVVHVEHLRGSRYARCIKAHIPDIPLIWDSVDCISYLFEQASSQSGSIFGKLITRLELTRTRKAESHLVTLFDHVLVTSGVDKKALLDLVANGSKPSPISVLVNGVDLDYFRPAHDVQSDPETLVFSGKMSYHANISMAKHLVHEIMPKIWQKRPGVRLVIVGKDPPADIQKWTDHPCITVTGTVEDIRPYLWRATVAVVPLVYGAGVQNKILEAMACGIPVVTTSRVLSSLQVQHEKDLLIADDPDGFSSQVLRLLDNPSLQYEIGKTGECYVREHHSWETIGHQLVDIYQQTIAQMRQL